MSATFPMKVLLLELDKPTSATGRTYPSTSIKAWMEKEENQKALENGFLGEWGQDRFHSTGITDISDRVDAVMSIYLENVCARITNVSLEENEAGAQLVGYIEPHGPKGKLLEENSQDIEVAVRALVNAEMSSGTLQYNIVDLVTFDIDYSKTTWAQETPSDPHASELDVTVIAEDFLRNPDDQYAELINDIRCNGSHKDDRTGTGSHSIFGAQMRFDLTGGKLPLLTTKKVHARAIIHELLWMLSGDTNVRYLKENNVNIWDSWVKPETAEYDGEGKLVAGELPKIYQHQWRHWDDTRIASREEVHSGKWDKLGFEEITFYERGGDGAETSVIHREIDQIANAIEQLKTNPDSRRILVSAWNVAEIDEMALPPCHTLFQFWTRELPFEERTVMAKKKGFLIGEDPQGGTDNAMLVLDTLEVPRRALSCQLYQR